jgi:hypothetical protein
MVIMNRQSKKEWRWLARLALGLLLLGWECALLPQQPAWAAGAKPSTVSQATYATPEAAGAALEAAARSGDEAALTHILGDGALQVLNSGDPIEDKTALASFVEKYERMNRWVTMSDGNRVLYIGADNYPYPIPLSRNASSRWYFNTALGKDEVLARRIGQNELYALDGLFAIARAEELYARDGHDGEPSGQYTTNILSTPGKQDGLYWKASDDAAASPLGQLNDLVKEVAASTSPGTAPIFSGFAFRILSRQGENARGGAENYQVDGKMTGGFAVLAWPITYGDSGIMTFVLSRDGVVYQKDLGPDTANLAKAITSYDPDQSWAPAE